MFNFLLIDRVVYWGYETLRDLFVFSVFSVQMGVFLPRDSKDQFTFSGFKNRAVSDLLAGNLIFFGFSEDDIRHVGMSLGGEEFIHTSAVTENKPFLRISNVSDPAWSGAGYYPFLAGRCLSLNK